ncbi:VOC family protein [Streptomyces botrytidirepellens]|uniref:VOC family protein n=1 Tax=Streptomyces botrytidirepellens TaxID=2486417 RepID=A0A3M8VMG6_9ACTN|nr:VOC family protein [Streptomyces botrytidirepellens]RNG18710.1 VOC family protein [Streptomyces botrytidirepellens]
MTEAATRRTPGTPCWTSLMVHSLAATQDFYHALFDWEFTPGPQQLGAYVRAVRDGVPVAGLGELPPERQLPVSWMTYLASHDADETAEMIRACGGTVAVGPLDADEAGRMLIAADPEGAVFGVWQEEEHAALRESGAPGTPVWHELTARDSGAVAKFYQMVFGYEPDGTRSASSSEPGEPGRRTLHLAGRPVCAIRSADRSLPRDRGAHWMTHFAVRDVDEAVRRVGELGGRVVEPPSDRATGHAALVSDREGAAFTVVRAEGA